MPRWKEEDDSWEDDEPYSGEETDEYAEDDYGDDDDAETEPCPFCFRQIHEDVQRCPHCGEYISTLDAPPSRKPWWIIIGAVVCLYLVFRWIMR